MTKIGVITQARMTSSRLPGKVLRELAGATMLEHHVQRLRAAGLEVFIATTINESDSLIVAEGARLGCGVYRGSEDDVLARYAGTAQKFDLDVVVRVTSDCPLIDGELVKRGIDKFIELADPVAFVSNTLERSFPRGFDFEVMDARALFDADRRATRPFEREHVTPFIYGSAGANILQITSEVDNSDLRLTLDTEKDFLLLREIFETYGGSELTGEGVVHLLRRVPELPLINADIEQKKIGS